MMTEQMDVYRSSFTLDSGYSLMANTSLALGLGRYAYTGVVFPTSCLQNSSRSPYKVKSHVQQKLELSG